MKGPYLSASSLQFWEKNSPSYERLVRIGRLFYSLIAVPIQLPLIALDTILNTRLYGRPSWTFAFRTFGCIVSHVVWSMNPGTRPYPEVLASSAREAIPWLKRSQRAELVVVPAKEGVWYGDALQKRVLPQACPCFWMWLEDKMVCPSTDPQPIQDRKVVMYFVGGGMVQGHPLESPLPWKVLGVIDTPIFGVNFRKAIIRENGFPAALQDAVSAFYYLIDQGFRPENICMMGDSGGDGIVTTTILYLRAHRDKNLLQPGRCILVSPFVDLVDKFQSDEDALNLDFLNPTMCSIAATQYCSKRPDLRGHLLSPGSKNFKFLLPPYTFEGLPDMLITYGDAEIFMPGIQRFINLVVEKGNKVEVHRGVDHVHVYPYYCKDRSPGGFYGRLQAFLDGDVRVGECLDY